MTFAAPLMLLTMVPWGGLVILLLLRTRPTTAVSFLQFWPVDEQASVKRALLGRPPWPIVFLLIAILLALIGAARPKATVTTPTSPPPSPEIHITAFAANHPPVSQVMVRLRTTHFDRPTAQVVIQSGDQRITRTVSIGADDEQTVFIDLTHPGPLITASIGGETEALQRAGNGIRLVNESAVPSSVRRLVDLYRVRHPGDGAAVAIGSELPPEQLGVVIAPAGNRKGPWTVVDDPLTRDVDWSKLSGGMAISQGWEPLVFRGETMLLARRTDAVKQLAVSVVDADWPAMPSFVVFWTNAMDWCAGGDGEYRRFQAEKNEGGPSGRPLNSKGGEAPTGYLSHNLYLASLLFLLLAAITYTPNDVHRTVQQAANSHG